MQAKDLSVADLVADSFLFQKDEGKVFFKDRRTIFTGADSYGTLRKDLISVLGHERAKVFLLRYGWNCGVNDAKYIKEMLPWEEELEWLHAAPKIHSIEGTVLVDSIELRANKEKGEFYSEGYWYHSYEAEQHIKHFGHHHEPVCSTLIGYAGGYGSYYLGRRVVFKEVECVGKGDPYCRYIGKPIEDWGTEINDILPLYEEENLSIELDRAYRSIEKQKEDLKKALSINEKLSNVLIQGGGLAEIVRKLGESLKTPVPFDDQNFNRIESFGDYREHELMRYIQISNGKRDPLIQKLMTEKRTVELNISEDFGWRHKRLIAPILLKNEICGYLSLVKEQGHFDEMEIITLERTANICAIQILHERSVIEVEQRVKGEFINELLLENSNKKSLLYQLKLMGYHLDKPHYIFVFKLQEINGISNNQKEFDWMEYREIAEKLLYQLNSYGRKCLVSSRLDQIIAVIPKELLNQTKLEPKAFGELLVNIINPNYVNYRITLGISSQCEGLHDFRGRYEEANKSIELANSSKLKTNVVTFDELGFLGLFLHAKDGQQWENFSMRLLKDLVAYDEENKGELLKTLYFF